jgi:hypothetical protein
MSMLRRAHFAGWTFPKRHRANYGVIAIICKVPILGRHSLLVSVINLLATVMVLGVVLVMLVGGRQ